MLTNKEEAKKKIMWKHEEILTWENKFESVKLFGMWGLWTDFFFSEAFIIQHKRM